MRIFASTQLLAAYWLKKLDEVVNKQQHPLMYFQKQPSRISSKPYTVCIFQISAKIPLEIRTILGVFESETI